MNNLGLTKLTTARTWEKPPPSPLQYILRLSMGATSKWHFVPRLPNGSLEIPRVETLMTLGFHNFVCKPPIAMRFEAKLYPSLRAFQQYVASHLNARKSGSIPDF
jgi:hypothetical protein